MNQDAEELLGSMGTKMYGLGPDRLHPGVPVCGVNTGQDAQVALAVSRVETVCPDHQQMVRTPWVIFLIHRTHRHTRGKTWGGEILKAREYALDWRPKTPPCKEDPGWDPGDVGEGVYGLDEGIIAVTSLAWVGSSA